MADEKTDGMSMDTEAAEREKLRAVFPQCFCEGKLDVDKLLNLCGEYITDDFEKYEFRWKGKSECLQLAGKRSTGTLRPCPEESVNFAEAKNLYIEGDNLEVLKLLQSSYYRRVKMIYIDPPYNTGNDFVYADDFADPIAKYKEVTEQTTKSNPETMGRFHTNWLNMMYPRLRLAANLLRDDGVIFISIDDNEVTNLRRLCDEVFGEENFVAQIVWQKRTSPDARTAFSTGHEYILVYCKYIAGVDKCLFPLPLSEDDKANFSNPDNDPKGPWVSSDFTAPGFRPNQMYAITTPSGIVVEPPKGRCWKNLADVYQQYLNEGRLWFGSDGRGVPRQKTYLFERNGKTGWTWWPNSEVGHTQEATQEVRNLLESPSFDFPKPVRLIKRMISLATSADSNDIILDFFSGSATTAHAVMRLNAEDGGNRRFILVQLPERTDEKSEAYKAGYRNICEIGKERIRRAGQKIKESCEPQPLISTYSLDFSSPDYGKKLSEVKSSGKPSPDIGFRVFKLDSSNLKIWDDSPITGEDAAQRLEARLWNYLDVLVPDRTDADMVYEVMLKLGQDLCEPIVEIPLGDTRKVYGVGEDVKFIVCLAAGVTPEDASTMAGYAPGRIAFAEQCFASSTDKSNVRLTLKDKGIAIKTL